MPSAVIGVDIGTQGVKAALFEASSGRCLSSATRASKFLRSKAGGVEEDPEFQVAKVCSAIAECVAKAPVNSGAVAAIGIDGQMAGILGIGDDGLAVTPYDSWLDTRCGPFITRMKLQAGDEIVRKTGGPPSFNHGPKILWWKHERPEVYRLICAFVQPSAYAVMRLCGLSGEEAFIDHTYLHFSGFADSRRRRWDADLCSRFKVAPEKLPRIVWPQDVVGRLTPVMARRCGLTPATAVVAGCGDTAASFLSCGAVAEGICVDVAGTASVFAGTTRAFHADTRHGLLAWGRSLVPGLWHPYAYINGGGMNLEWFRRQFAAGEGGKAATWKAMEELARRAKSSAGPIFIPHLAGRVSPPQPALRGAWVGLTHAHTRGDLYRAVLEGVALEYTIYRDTLLEYNRGLHFRELRVTGGGQQSALWNQIKADALGMPVRRIVNSIGAPMGAAMLAAWGVGILSGLTQAAKAWIRPGHAKRPRPSMSDYYRKRSCLYRSLIERLDIELK